MPRLPFRAPADLPGAVAAAREALAAHGVIAAPTETFYGLSVDPADPAAVDRVRALKGRAGDRHLLVIGADFEQLAGLVEIAGDLERWLRKVWPAPLSVVLRARRSLAAAGETLAVRVPDHALLRALLERTGPLTSTSANRSGGPPAASADEVAAAFGERVALLLDGGDTPGGLPSTLIDATGNDLRVVRAGAWPTPPDGIVKPA
ncbi:MAG: putative dsRNA-binding protein, predicted ribosome maturation factor [Acidobacteria bacterium]|jgi:L-threonylcarbamoyladenylate synthase|nr:putative dsRNA-binding protein, predicted ribosome maturation factor [Acidobacteriota bacterium]